MTHPVKTFWYDNLRVIATIGVICIHVSSDYQPETGTIPNYSFWIGNIFDSLSRFSVPVFVMLSGALLLSKEDGVHVFWKKRIMRLLVPFLFWSSIYMVKYFWNSYGEGIRFPFWGYVRELLLQLRDGSSLHFWYIYMIFGVYLFVPIIGKWVRNSSPKEHLYFLGIWALTIILGQPILETFKPAIELSYFSGFLGYLVLGYFLNQRKFESKRQQNWISLSLIGVGVAATVLGTYLIHYYTGKYESTFYECLSPNILLYSSGVFLFLKDKDITFRPLVKVRDLISKYSYGIFLVHVLVFFKLQEFGVSWNFVDPLIGIPLTVTICLVVSLLIVFVVAKLPYGKYVSG